MSSRPPEHLVHGIDGPIVILTARVCAYLNKYASLDSFRADHRGQDAEVDATLVAMRVAALSWRGSATGTRQAAQPEPASGSQWLSTTQAAQHLGITDRGVRTAIDNNRIKATKVDGRWRITREAIVHYRTRNETG